MDVVVIGAGPAGMAAAADLAGTGHDVVLLEASIPGGQLFDETMLVPTTGRPTTGDDLAVSLQEEVASRGARFEFGEAIGLDVSGDRPVVATSVGRWEARAVVVATGTRRRPIPTSAGPVSEAMTCHCLPCDGPMLLGRRIVLVGTAAPFERDVELCRAITSEVVVVTAEDDPPLDLTGLEAHTGELLDVRGRPGALQLRVRTADGAVDAFDATAIVATGGFEPVTGWLDAALLEPGGWLADRHGPWVRVAGSVRHELRHAGPFEVEADGRRIAADLSAALTG